MAIIPAFWEAKAGGSPEVGSSRPAWSTWLNPVSTKNAKLAGHVWVTERDFVPPPPQKKKRSECFASLPEKITGSDPSHKPRVLPMAVSALGRILTTRLDAHNCQQDGQGAAASARFHQHPARCQQAQELEANAGSAGSLGFSLLKAQGDPLDKALRGSKTISSSQALALTGWRTRRYIKMAQVRQLTPVIALWEAKVGGSLEPRSLRPAWAMKRDPVFTKNTAKKIIQPLIHSRSAVTRTYEER
ncbi:putative uncharacterized protein C8orf44 [Plecturocebus cupreus]